MSNSRRNMFGLGARHGMPWRLISYVLLILASLGYGGLPSNPPAGLYQTGWISLAEASGNAFDHRLFAPTQAKEYRKRLVIVADLADEDPPALDAGACLPAEISCLPAPGGAAAADTVVADLVTLPAAGASARAPPLPLKT